MSTVPKLTLEEYDAMIARGEFEPHEDHRVELIYGELRPMSPIGPVHDDVLRILTNWSVRSINEDEVQIRIQSSLGIPELDSIPQPDVAWLREGNYRNRRPEPADVLLVIEVSDSSISFDLGEKLALYAQAGVSEYWVVNVPKQNLEVFRSPSKKGYRKTKVYTPGQTIAPLAYPDAVLEIAKLF